VTLLPAGSGRAPAARKVRVVSDANPAVSCAVVYQGSGGAYREAGVRPAHAAPARWDDTQRLQKPSLSPCPAWNKLTRQGTSLDTQQPLRQRVCASPAPMVTMPSGTVNATVVASVKVSVTVWLVMARTARDAGGVTKKTASATAETSSVAGASAA